MSEPGAVGGDVQVGSIEQAFEVLQRQVRDLRDECDKAFKAVYVNQDELHDQLVALKAKSMADDLQIKNLTRTIELLRKDGRPSGMSPRAGEGPSGSESRPAALTPLPKKYAGEPNGFNNFITHCRLHFKTRPALFQTDEQKTTFMLLLMEGRALQWASPFITRDDPILRNFEGFLELLTNVFSKRFHAQTRKQEFLNIKQGNYDLVSYIAYFQHLAAEVDWPEDPQISLFHKGLNDSLKEAISFVHPLPETLSGFFDLCLRANHRLKERKGGSRSEYRFRALNELAGDKGEPMILGELSPQAPEKEKEAESTVLEENQEGVVVGELRGPLTPLERTRRRELNLCFYCGKPGHSINKCTIRPFSGNVNTQREGRL